MAAAIHCRAGAAPAAAAPVSRHRLHRGRAKSRSVDPDTVTCLDGVVQREIRPSQHRLLRLLTLQGLVIARTAHHAVAEHPLDDGGESLLAPGRLIFAPVGGDNLLFEQGENIRNGCDTGGRRRGVAEFTGSVVLVSHLESRDTSILTLLNYVLI